MKKITYICDKCKAEISGEINEVLGFDLCDSCLKGAKKAMSDYVRGIGASSWDKGKAQALRDAGWTISRIAAELGVSEPTISKNTKPAKPKKVRPLEWAESEPDLKASTRSVIGEKMEMEEVSA